jgi:hypothetical protein
MTQNKLTREQRLAQALRDNLRKRKQGITESQPHLAKKSAAETNDLTH